MKKILIICCIIFASITPIHAQNTLAQNAGSSILIDSNSNQILYANNENEKMYPASTTKIMTMILLFEAINDERITFDDVVTTSSYAASMGGSQVYLETGEQMSVYDMFKSIAIASANDASVAIGQKIGGSIETFVGMMNEKANELDLKNTNFMNATGLHDDNHFTCANDLAIMASYLIEIGGEDLFNVTSLYDSYIRESSGEKFWLVNTNKLLKLYDGVDGLKTGYTKEAGYCLVSTVEKDGVRLIGVVLNEKDPTTRNNEMCELLDYGFTNFKNELIFKKDETIDTLNITNSTIQSIEIYSKVDISILKKVTNKDEITYDITYGTNEPPIYKDVPIGTLNIYLSNELIEQYSVYSKVDIEKQTMLEKIWLQFKRLL